MVLITELLQFTETSYVQIGADKTTWRNVAFKITAIEQQLESITVLIANQFNKINTSFICLNHVT